MKLAAIIITYEPDFTCLKKLLNALHPQVDVILIIDNNSTTNVQSFVYQNIDKCNICICLNKNYGIAYAQNEGIQKAISLGCEYVLLMDQDSVPALDMVKKLIDGLFLAGQEGNSSPIAAVGPAHVDARTGEKSLFIVEHNGLPQRQRHQSINNRDIVDVSFLIASGTLIPVAILQDIGGKRSNYFIDHVDTEWCFRARLNGYRLLGVPNAEMQHTLGDRVKRIWFFGYRNVAYHSPLRDYYMFRNTLLMLRDVKISLMWRLNLLLRLLQFSGYFLLFSSERGSRFYYMRLGLCHGLFGISGQLNIKTSRCELIPISELDPI